MTGGKAVLAMVAGAQDAAFVAQGCAPAMTPLTGQGACPLLPGVGHLGVVDAPATADLVIAFLGQFR